MSETTQWLWGIAGIIAIGGLLAIIRNQLLSQRAAQQAHAARMQEFQAQAQQQRDYLEESVKVIASGIRDEQCEVVEGCIRLKKLLDHLAPYLHEHPSFAIFNQVYEQTKHVPMLEAWKQLTPAQRESFRKEMEAVERAHKSAVQSAATELLSHSFRQ
ncbi:MAG TPA: DUF2489 domain-containing protein [Motiliproteus sp.]